MASDGGRARRVDFSGRIESSWPLAFAKGMTCSFVVCRVLTYGACRDACLLPCLNHGVWQGLVRWKPFRACLPHAYYVFGRVWSSCCQKTRECVSRWLWAGVWAGYYCELILITKLKPCISVRWIQVLPRISNSAFVPIRTRAIFGTNFQEPYRSRIAQGRRNAQS